MQVSVVPGVRWQGRKINAVMIVRDGPLSNDSVVFVPTFHLLQLAKSVPEITLKAIASDLKRYFESLEIAHLPWDEVTDDQMSGYIETTLIKKYQLSERSISRHCSSIKGMYTKVSEIGLTDKFFDYSFRYYNEAFLEIQGAAPPSKNFRLRKKYINDPLFEVLLEHASPSVGFLRDRNELILCLGKQLGLRSAEVTSERNLKLSELNPLLSLIKKRRKLAFSVSIIGKRNKIREVDISPDLVQRISKFIETHRHGIPGDQLICAQDGKCLSPSFASRLFDQAKKTSLSKLKSCYEELSAQDDAPYTISWKSIKNLTFHCLRHTYATNLVTYAYQNGFDPYSYLPSQLGHTDPKTTKQYTDFYAVMHNIDPLRQAFSIKDSHSE